MATNYPSYFFDSRTDSPRQRLAEVLAAPNVGGTAQAGGFSSAGAVRADAPNGGFGAALLSAIQNYNAVKQDREKMDLIKGEKASEQAQREQLLQARTNYLVKLGVSPENAASYAGDADTFKSAVEQITKEPQIVNGHMKMPDGSWKRVIPEDKTNFEREYEFAVSQGYKGTPDEWKKSGSQNINIGGDGVDGMKLNESQQKAILSYNRGLAANDLLNQHQGKLLSFGETNAGSVPLIGNYLTSPEYQVANQAGTDFAEMVLRMTTGASYTKEEVEKTKRIYIPQPGDSPEVIATKQAARENFLAGVRIGFGTAAPAAKKIESDREAKTPSVEEKPDAQATGKDWSTLDGGIKIREK